MMTPEEIAEIEKIDKCIGRIWLDTLNRAGPLNVARFMNLITCFHVGVQSRNAEECGRYARSISQCFNTLQGIMTPEEMVAMAELAELGANLTAPKGEEE